MSVQYMYLRYLDISQVSHDRGKKKKKSEHPTMGGVFSQWWGNQQDPSISRPEKWTRDRQAELRVGRLDYLI